MSNLGLGFLKAIMIEEKFSYLEDLDIRWFKDDDLDIFKYCKFLYLTKKHPSYEQVKGCIELSKDMKDYKRDDLVKRLQFIKDGLFILPPDDPINVFMREHQKNVIKTDLEKIKGLELDSQIATIMRLSEKLKVEVSDSNTFNLQDEINSLADDLEEGVANDTSGSIDLTKHWDNRSEVLSNQMQNWKKLLGFTHIMPKLYMFAARPRDFKTSLLIDMNVMLYRMGRRGLYLSFEDTKDDLRVKFISQIHGIDKGHLVSVTKDPELAKKIRKPKDEKIIIHDKCLDYDKLASTVEFYMSKYQIDYISLDYVQLFTGQIPDRDKMNYVAQDLMEVTRKYKIPFFCLSQVSKDDTNKDSADSRLNIRHLKDSKKLAETPRFVGTLFGDNHTTQRTWNRDKNTWGSCGELTIDFDGPTGAIKSVYEDNF